MHKKMYEKTKCFRLIIFTYVCKYWYYKENKHMNI